MILVSSVFTSVLRLKVIDNAAARRLPLSIEYAHISPDLHSLHQLPVDFRIRFKVLLLTHGALKGHAHDFLCQLLTKHCPARGLGYQAVNLMVIPCTYLKAKGTKAFQCVAPKCWKSLHFSFVLLTFEGFLSSHLLVFLFIFAVFFSMKGRRLSGFKLFQSPFLCVFKFRAVVARKKLYYLEFYILRIKTCKLLSSNWLTVTQLLLCLHLLKPAKCNVRHKLCRYLALD